MSQVEVVLHACRETLHNSNNNHDAEGGINSSKRGKLVIKGREKQIEQ